MLGDKLFEKYGVQFFRAIDPILLALNVDHAHFVPFGSININKAFSRDKIILLPCIFQLISPFEGSIMLPTEFVVSFDGACLTNLYLSSGLGKFIRTCFATLHLLNFAHLT